MEKEKIQEKKSTDSLEKSSIKMTVTKELEDKIRYLCSAEPDREWSGVLFYKVKGTDFSKMKITAVDLFLMDIGSAGFTEFIRDPSIGGYLADHPELLECCMGLIHSHNRMTAFFSGQDRTTLGSEGAETCHFLSLIVNNAGSYVARITRKVWHNDTVKRVLSYETFGGKMVSIGNSEFTEDDFDIEDYPVNITVEHTAFNELHDRLASVKSTLNTVKKFDRDFPSWNNEWLDSHKDASYKVFNHQPLPDAPAVKQLQLWDDKLEAEKVEDGIPDGNYYSLTVKKFVNTILTMSVFVNEKFDIKKWMPTMEKLYQKRFGITPDELAEFSTISDSFIAFAIEELYPTEMFDELETDNILSSAISEITSLGRNSYTDIIIENLKDAMSL